MSMRSPIPWRPLALVSIAASAVLSLHTCSSSGTPVTRPIVLVSIDTLHVDRTGVYNPDVDFTPFLKSFADDGVRFDRTYTHTAITLPSHASLMTGMSPQALGVMANGDRVPEEAEMLAETLRAEGYQTAAFISLGVLRPAFGTAQGFDDFGDPFAGPSAGRSYQRADEVWDQASAWIQKHHEAPFFAWLHFSDPHEPYVPLDPPPDAELWLDDVELGTYNLTSAERYRVPIEIPPGQHELRWVSRREARDDDLETTALEVLLLNAGALVDGEASAPNDYLPVMPRARVAISNQTTSPVSKEVVFTGRVQQPPPSEVFPNYDASIAYVDEHLEKLDGLLDSLGLREDALVVIVSDHGEGLYTHDILGHAAYTYEHQTRALWMMRGSGIPAGTVVSERPALLMDFVPTLREVLGLPERDHEGQSLVGCWDGSTCPSVEPWWAFGLSHDSRRLTSMASYRWPYKWIWRRRVARTAFNVADDPWEASDLLSDDQAPAPAPLRESAESFRDERQRLSDILHRGGQQEMDPEQERILRSLGYLGTQKR